MDVRNSDMRLYGNNVTEMAISLSVRTGNALSVIECTRIEKGIFHSVTREGTWFYFNRLSVKPQVRNRGIATFLLQNLVEIADGNCINIFCDINPYGDLNLEQLISLYGKFEFELLPNLSSTMVRQCKFLV